jgi:flagellar hook-associated protein 3 FlgL
MTTSISSTGFGYSTTLMANAASVRQQLDVLTEQASSGRVADTYAGLGNAANVSLSLSPQIASMQNYSKNIDQATGSMQVTQTAMTQIQNIAAAFVAVIPNLNGLNPSEVDSVAANARSALSQVAGLLDSKNGDVYVFGGQDTANPPVPAPDAILSSNFYTQINTAVSTLSTNGATTTTAATLTIAGSNDPATSPFSTYMSQPVASIGAPLVQTGDSTTVQTGLLASGNSGPASVGTSTTGSYMRDLMRALATLGSMTASQVNDPAFHALVQDTGTSLNTTVSAMATDVGILGTTQSNLTKTQTQLTATTTALTSQVASGSDADLASTLSKLTAMQTQLQVSYRLISSANSLSLINFLPAA